MTLQLTHTNIGLAAAGAAALGLTLGEGLLQPAGRLRELRRLRLTRHTPAPAAEDAATPAAAAAPRAATTTGHPASTPLVPQAQPDIARAAAHFGLEL